MLSIITLLIVLVLSILITRIATVALTHTGLSKQSARFQARSAFTGVGFTTSESEKVVSHPVRRKILLILMLLGNAGIVTAISTLIISFININTAYPIWLKVTVLITGLMILWTVAHSAWVDRHLSNIISKMLGRYTQLAVYDFAGLLHLAGDYQITELKVEPGDWLANRSLKKLGLRNEGVAVLGITRIDGDYIGAPFGDTEIRKHDTLILYGTSAAIEKLDQRKKGILGDIEHVEEVDKQKERIEEQHKKDSSVDAEND